MNEHKIKRVAVMLIMAIVVIMFFKYLLTRAVTNLGNAVEAKKHSAIVQQATMPANGIPVAETPDVSAGSAAKDSGVAVSSVESTAY